MNSLSGPYDREGSRSLRFKHVFAGVGRTSLLEWVARLHEGDAWNAFAHRHVSLLAASRKKVSRMHILLSITAQKSI